MPRSKAPPKLACSICGEVFPDATLALGHRLVAHTAKEPSRRMRMGRARAALGRIHRRLEGMGLDEVQSHQVTQALAEELHRAHIL